MDRRAGSQRPPITRSREDRHVTRMALMDRSGTSRALSQELGVVYKTKTYLHEQFDDVSSSTDSQLGDQGCGYPCRGITDRSFFKGVINDEPGCTNVKTSQAL
ncbi:hypothetical protein TNCV_1630241 [Trichonephila clavipes]|uniref:Uncharacterized protein n=1 Tax=Trichonephila clavipes TaxID=2585209 RepID=A0A8X6VWJ2_TRICX|nr:hypothetical protein TNCV_1630241 [Trichonephila clavipes]